jgi:sulfate-transporting ATPase
VTEFVQFAILGIAIGAGYALIAQGIVLIYRGSGVLNFAQGAVAMFCAYIFYQLRSVVPLGVALVLSLLCAVAFGAVIQFLVMRPLKGTSPLVRMIATLGILLVLQSAATIIWGNSAIPAEPFLPQHAWLIGGITITADRIILVGLVLVITALGWWIPQRTNFGRATLAVAESERSTAALGWSPETLATVNWMFGSLMAGLAGIFMSPFIGALDTTILTLVVIAALAAALVGGLNSLPWTLVGALGVGIAQTVIPLYWSLPSSGQIVPFFVIVVILVMRGRSLPVRGQLQEKLPGLGTGRANPWVIIPIVVAVVAVVLFAVPHNYNLLDALILSGVGAILMLSLVLAMGFGGQLCLAQYAIAGVAALVAGHLSQSGWGFLEASAVGVIAATALGSLVAIPALRTRGVSLAIVTVGLGLAAQETLFSSPALTGGISGVNVGSTTIFGLQVSSVEQPARYCAMVAIVFAVLAICVGNIRRGRAGRRLIAMRGNERAAAALGINLFEAKVYAYTVASAIAAIAGVLLAYTYTSIDFTIFSPLNSITILAFAVIGGIGYVTGSVAGSFLVAGGIATWLFSGILGTGLTEWFALFGGALLVVNLIIAPDGLAKLQALQFAILKRRVEPLFLRLARRGHVVRQVDSGAVASDEYGGAAFAPTSNQLATAPTRSEPATSTSNLGVRDLIGGTRLAPTLGEFASTTSSLEVRNLTVRFGGVVAVNDVSFRIDPGTVVGLIGPNGAGKTTVIDAITGFVTPSQGEIILGTTDITSWPAHGRVRAGLSRSFQSLELFDDLTVEDNLRTASDPSDRWAYLTNLVSDRNTPLGGAASAAVNEFGLVDDLQRLARDLPQGRRRLLAAARAVAVQPTVLLLDEPGAGLGDELVPELIRLVRRLAQEAHMAVLLVEHDMDLVMSVCDRVIVLDFGQKLAEGSPKEIQSNPLVIASYLGGSPGEFVAHQGSAPT